MKRYVAQTSVGASTTRGYKKARQDFQYADFLAGLRIEKLATKTEGQFIKWLNTRTKHLSREISPKGYATYSTWGIARKILNIFLHNVYFNEILRTEYNLGDIKDHFEVPLDSHVVGWLRRIAESTEPAIEFIDPVPGTFYVHLVTDDVNSKYQGLATKVARQLGTSRVYLDTYLYRARDYLWIYQYRIE